MGKVEEVAEVYAKEHCGYYDVISLKNDQSSISPGGDLSFFLGAKKGFISGAKWQRENPEWVSVEERLPENDDLVLVWRWTVGEYEMARCIKRSDDSRRWLFNGTEYFAGMDGISHWLPIHPPKELEDK